MLYKAIICSLGLLILTNCNAQKKPTKSIKNPPSTSIIPEKTPMKEGNIIYFKEGENKFLKEYEMNVTFKGMSEDSRCPKDVNCVWAGVATANIEVMGLATRPMMIKLSTIDNTGKGYFKTDSFNGYSISLVSVTPETTSDKGFNALKGSYKIGLKFTKGNTENPTQRGGTTTK